MCLVNEMTFEMIEWNKLGKEEKFAQMVPLLRTYQKEVDRLTSRAKQAEEAFLHVYQVVSKVPAVGEAEEMLKEIFAILGTTSKLEAMNKKLQVEVDGYKADFKELSSQEMTVRKQEELIAKYESDLARLTSEGEIDAEKKVEVRFTQELERKEETITQLKSEIRKISEISFSAQRDRDIAQTQLSHIESRHRRDLQAKQSEVDMLSSEVETLTLSLAEKQLLSPPSSPLQQSSSSSLSTSKHHDDDEHERLIADSYNKDLMISQLSSKVDELNSTLEKEREQFQSQMEDQEHERARLKKDLENLPNFETWLQVQARLTALEGLESYVGVSTNELMEKGVDVVLKDKLKKTERSNVELKLALKDLEARHNTILEDLKKLQSVVVEKDKIIERLEEKTTGIGPSRTNLQVSSSNPSLSSSSEKEKSSSSGNTSSGSIGAASSEEYTTMIGVLKSQRDRFKTRAESLEAEKDRLNEQLRVLTVKAQSLQEDNLLLYQKMKFVQSYASGSSSSSSIPSNMNESTSNRSRHATGSTLDLELGNASGLSSSTSSSNVEDKYRTIYEHSVNPFAAFADREKSKRVAELNSAEKLLLSSSSFFFATRNTRMILFAYLILLHMFVVFVTYRNAVSSTNFSKNADAT